MEDKELADGKLGAEGVYSVEFKDGKLKLSIGYDGKGADAGIYLDLEPGYFLDQLAKAIPGEVDDTIIKLLKAGFGL